MPNPEFFLFAKRGPPTVTWSSWHDVSVATHSIATKGTWPNRLAVRLDAHLPAKTFDE